MQIAPHLPKIISLISSHPVVSIVAATGSGKSVGIPAGIAATGARCFVSVPTRTAAISLAEYQTALQRAANPNINVDDLIGYAAESKANYGPKPKLPMSPVGTVEPIDFCDVIFADEVHSGSLSTTEILSLWMAAYAAGVKVPRLVIASATPVPIIIEPTPEVYIVESVGFPIDYKYLAKDLDIDDPNGALYTQTANLANEIHRSTPINTGHILIFAAGSSEVETIASSLSELLKEPADDKIVDIIPAFGALKQEDIALIYKQTNDKERKIVIATNIAEMSITIENVGHVIDTMVEKRAETSQSGGFRLTTRYISKDSAKQRTGRTGRTGPGICYRMCTLERYNKLEDHRPPEIQRVPIYETVMELLSVGLNPEFILKGVDPQRVTTSLQLLNKLGMIENGESGVIVTDSGHFAPKFPLSVRNAVFLWKWIQAGNPIFPGIVVAALIDSYGPSYFWIPRKKPSESVDEYGLIVKAHKAKYFSKYIAYNDLETSLNMWNDLTQTIGGIHGSQRKIIEWTRANSINNKKIRELLLIIEQSVNAANRLGYNFQIGPFTTNGAMNLARPLLSSVYSDMTLIQQHNTRYFNPITKEEYSLDNRDAVNELAANLPVGIIALVTAEIKTQRGLFRLVGFAVDTDKDGLGRPIVNRNRTVARGTRTIIHPRQPRQPIEPTTATQQPITGVNDALDLLSTLKIGEQEQNITNALDLLSTLNIGGSTPTIPIVPRSPTIPTPTIPIVPRSPTIPVPTVPRSPTIPVPTVPAPTIPIVPRSPIVPAPTISTPTIPAPTIPTPTIPIVPRSPSVQAPTIPIVPRSTIPFPVFMPQTPANTNS